MQISHLFIFMKGMLRINDLQIKIAIDNVTFKCIFISHTLIYKTKMHSQFIISNCDFLTQLMQTYVASIVCVWIHENIMRKLWIKWNVWINQAKICHLYRYHVTIWIFWDFYKITGSPIYVILWVDPHLWRHLTYVLLKKGIALYHYEKVLQY